MAATHTDLAQAVRRGEFREDLFYRMNVVSLTLPPLRDRGEDVQLLADAFAESLAARYGLPRPELTAEVRSALREHTWPGNVRELRHAVERALLLSDPGKLDPALLAPTAHHATPSSTAALPFPARLDDIVAAAARATVERHHGNKSAAARQLGVSRSRLQRLLERGDD
jgi:DNA-binding NtrC family response regulator